MRHKHRKPNRICLIFYLVDLTKGPIAQDSKVKTPSLSLCLYRCVMLFCLYLESQTIKSVIFGTKVIKDPCCSLRCFFQELQSPEFFCCIRYKN